MHRRHRGVHVGVSSVSHSKNRAVEAGRARDRATCGERGQQCRHETVDVKERHHVQAPVAGRQSRASLPTLRAEARVPVRERHDLRPRCRPGRVEHERVCAVPAPGLRIGRSGSPSVQWNEPAGDDGSTWSSSTRMPSSGQRPERGTRRSPRRPGRRRGGRPRELELAGAVRGVERRADAAEAIPRNADAASGPFSSTRATRSSGPTRGADRSGRSPNVVEQRSP